MPSTLCPDCAGRIRWSTLMPRRVRNSLVPTVARICEVIATDPLELDWAYDWSWDATTKRKKTSRFKRAGLGIPLSRPHRAVGASTGSCGFLISLFNCSAGSVLELWRRLVEYQTDKEREDASWQATVGLISGQRYRFRYLIDGQEWLNDWKADPGFFDHVVRPRILRLGGGPQPRSASQHRFLCRERAACAGRNRNDGVRRCRREEGGQWAFLVSA